MSNKKIDDHPVVLLKRDDRTERAIAAVIKRQKKTCSICHEIGVIGLKIMSEKTGQIFKTELSTFLHGESTSSLLYSCKMCCDSLEKVVNLKSTISILKNEIANILNALKKTGLINRMKVTGQAEIIKTRTHPRSPTVRRRNVQAEHDNEANSPEMKKWLQANGLISPDENDDENDDDVIMMHENDDVIILKEEPLGEVETSDEPEVVDPAQISPIVFVDNIESVVEVIIETENVTNTTQAVHGLRRKSPTRSSPHVGTGNSPVKDDPVENHHRPTPRKSRVLAGQLIRKNFQQNEQQQSDEEDDKESQGDEKMDDGNFESNSDHDDDSSSDIFFEKVRPSLKKKKPTAGESSELVTKNLSCKFCPKKYSFNKDLRRHLKRLHSDVASSDMINGKQPVNPPQVQCQFCEKKYRFRKNLRDHLNSIHSDVWNPNTHCPYCSETFSEASALKEHLKTHPSKDAKKVTSHAFESTICDVCGKQFKTYPGLVSHRAKVHPDPDAPTPPTIPCPTCNSSYPTKRRLRCHVYHVHENPGQFQCTHCTRKFNWKKSLTEHLVKHTGDKPFSCGNCGRSFSERGGLRRHRQVVCNPDKEQAQRVREMRAQREKLYRERQKTNSKKCKICKKLFKSEKTLEIHVDRVHSKKGEILQSSDDVSSESESE